MAKAKLRGIDRGTRYDISGGIRRLVRQIESGEMQPRDVIVLTRATFQNNSSPEVKMHHYGFGSVEDMHWMLATAQGRIEPQ